MDDKSFMRYTYKDYVSKKIAKKTHASQVVNCTLPKKTNDSQDASHRVAKKTNNT